MKAIFKKISLFAMIALLLLGTVACKGGPSDASGTHGDIDWEYSANDKTLSLSGEGDMDDLDSASEIPWASVIASAETIEIGHGISTIASYAFYGASAVTEIEIPASVARIGDYAFAFCGKLENVTLPEGLLSVGEGAFEGCYSLEAAFVPASVTEVGARAFALCSGAQHAAVLGDATIGEQAFYYCSSLEDLLLNENIIAEDIASDAFLKASVDASDASFTASEAATATVTVHFVDENDETLIESVVKADLAYGSEYAVSCPAKEGYTPEKLTVSGYVYGEDVVHTVRYTKDAVEEQTTPADDKEEDDEPISITTVIAIVIFVVVLGGIGVAAYFLMRADKKAKSTGNTVRKNGNDKKRK